MYSIDLSWVWVDTIGIVEAAEEVDGLSLHMYFLWINTKSYLRAICIRSHRQASCSASVQPCTVMLSAIPIHPWHSSGI